MELAVRNEPSNRLPTVSSPTQSPDNPDHRFHRLHQGIDFTLADDRGKAAHASRSQHESMIEQSQMEGLFEWDVVTCRSAIVGNRVRTGVDVEQGADLRYLRRELVFGEHAFQSGSHA